MTATETTVTDVRLPGGPGGAHIAAAEAMVRRLATAFPAAGVGITGSVGMGVHRPESDLDMVLVDASFRRDMQFATVSQGIPTAVVCLRPAFDAERERRWMLASGGDVRVVSMVRSAFVAWDPEGVLQGMQHAVARLDEERRTRRDALVQVRREDGLKMIHALRGGTPMSDEHLQMQLFAAIVDGWYLGHGLAMDTRQASERMLETIAGRDAPLFSLLRRAIPLTQASMALLLRAFDHVFEPGPAQE